MERKSSVDIYLPFDYHRMSLAFTAMLAFDFSEKSIEVLQFKKPLFRRLAIVALGKAELEDEILKVGLPKNENTLSEKILELLGENKNRNNEECLFNLPPGSFIFKRLSLALDLSKELLQEEVETALVEETGTAVANLVYSFGRVRLSDFTQEVLVFSTPKEVLDSFRRVFLQIGLVPIFAIAQPWAVYQGLEEALDDRGLTAVLEAKDDNLGLSFFDSFGPISDFKGKIGTKTLIKDFGNARVEVEEQNVRQVSKLILAGGSSAGLDPLFLEKKLDLSIGLAAEYIALQIKERAADLSQIKLPTTLFAKTLGLMLAFENSQTEFNLISKKLGTVKVGKEFIKKQKVALQDSLRNAKIKDKEKDKNNKEEIVEETMMQSESRGTFAIKNYIRVASKRLVIGGVILLLLIGGSKIVMGAKGILSNRFTRFINNTFSSPTPTEAPSPMPTLTVTPLPPTPTSTPVLLKSDLKISVLNGSGIKGSANSAADFLKALGYNVTKTGNAVRYDYLQTTIAIKESKRAYLGQLQTDLATKYQVNAEIGMVAESELFDAQVVVGQK